MVAPVYASQSGLPQDGIAIFMALAIIGGLVAQLPAGMIADRISRRATLIGFSVFAILVCGAISMEVTEQIAGIPFVYVGSFLFGFATLPIYSICASHASDFAKQEDMLAMSASLIFFYAIGSVLAPSFAGYLIGAYGPQAMFNFIMAAHIALLGYTVWRFIIGRVGKRQRPYNYMPRTSLFIVDIIRRRKRDGAGEK